MIIHKHQEVQVHTTSCITERERNQFYQRTFVKSLFRLFIYFFLFLLSFGPSSFIIDIIMIFDVEIDHKFIKCKLDKNADICFATSCIPLEIWFDHRNRNVTRFFFFYNQENEMYLVWNGFLMLRFVREHFCLNRIDGFRFGDEMKKKPTTTITPKKKIIVAHEIKFRFWKWYYCNIFFVHLMW